MADVALDSAVALSGAVELIAVRMSLDVCERVGHGMSPLRLVVRRSCERREQLAGTIGVLVADDHLVAACGE